MNSRSCERSTASTLPLKGYAAMAAGLAGDQWNEGDVSCSVVRRVMLPDAFFAIDGLFETALSRRPRADGSLPAVIERETRHLPCRFCSPPHFMEAVKSGPAQAAHEAIKEHAVAAAMICAEEASNQ
ncbi:MAG: hypothetical protein R3F11_13845 [Verrucomicrobiales bacterium]